MKTILLSFLIGGITGGVSSHYMIKESEGGFLLSIIVGLITLFHIRVGSDKDALALLVSAFIGFYLVGMITWYCK